LTRQLATPVQTNYNPPEPINNTQIKMTTNLIIKYLSTLSTCLLVIFLARCDDSQKQCSENNNFSNCSSDNNSGICLNGNCVELTPCNGNCNNNLYFPLPDTNLRVCHQDSPEGSDGTILCPGQPGNSDCSEVDYCGQDAQYGWDLHNPPEERFKMENGDNSENMVKDRITGLSWQLCSRGQSGTNCNGTALTSTWHEAANYCEQSTWGGYEDWKLPNRYELQSIVDYGTTSPAINTEVFINSPSHFQENYDMWWIECVWSASDYHNDTTAAWALMVNSGDISQGSGLEYHLHDKDASGWPGCYTRCVRASNVQQEYRRFIADNSILEEPIVADRITSLIWQRCSAGQNGSQCTSDATMTDWKSSLAYCQQLEWAGIKNWRLPNIQEISSLIDSTYSRPAINSEFFPNTPYYGPITHNNAGQYWSSTGRSYNSFALYADFTSGFTHFYKQPELRHVRCVSP
jgi:hypothetical protein